MTIGVWLLSAGTGRYCRPTGVVSDVVCADEELKKRAKSVSKVAKSWCDFTRAVRKAQASTPDRVGPPD